MLYKYICWFYCIRIRVNKSNFATSNVLKNMNIWMDIYIIFFYVDAFRLWRRKIILLRV